MIKDNDLRERGQLQANSLTSGWWAGGSCMILYSI